MVKPRKMRFILRMGILVSLCAGVATLVIFSGYLSRWKPVEVIYTKENANQPALRMEIYRAQTGGGNYPAVLFFHGGGWITGSPDQFRWFAKRFAACGVVSALVEYRVYSRHGVLPDSAVEDANKAYAWIQRHHARFEIDPSHIALVGGSAGAHIAAASALTCKNIDCAGNDEHKPFAMGLLNPVIDIKNATQEEGYTPEELKLIGALGKQKEKSLSIGMKLIASGIPTLLIYGEKDPLLARASQLMALRNQTNMQRQEILIAPNQEHGFFNFEPWRSTVADTMLNFLRQAGARVDCRPTTTHEAELISEDRET